MFTDMNCGLDGYTKAIAIYQNCFNRLCFSTFKHRIAYCRWFLALQGIKLMVVTVLNITSINPQNL